MSSAEIVKDADGKVDAGKLLGVYNGATDGYRQQLMEVKNFIAANFNLNENYTARYRWEDLDTFICKMDELDALFKKHIRNEAI